MEEWRAAGEPMDEKGNAVMGPPDKGPCPLVTDFEEARIEQLLGLEWLTETDLPMIKVLVKHEIVARLCEAWFFRTALWRKRGANPAAQMYGRALAGMAAACKELGLTPKARMDLGLRAGEGESLMRRIARERAEAAAREIAAGVGTGVGAEVGTAASAEDVDHVDVGPDAVEDAE